jgi:hypothetical protein
MNEEITQTSEPQATPEAAPVNPASPTGQATGLDLNALNQRLSSLGDGYSVTNVDDVVRIINDKKTGMHAAQNEKAKLQERLRRVEPLLTEAEQNPEFQRYLYEKANEFASGGTAGIDPSVTQVLNPVYNEIESIKLSLAERQMQDQLDSLARDPDIGHLVTKDVQQDLLIEARASGRYDLTDHFWRKYGRSALQTARTTGKQEAVKAIQDTNNAYPQGSAPNSTGAVAPAMDFSKMTQNDIDAYIQNEATKILNDNRYRDKVLGQ